MQEERSFKPSPSCISFLSRHILPFIVLIPDRIFSIIGL
jgi:hypothetical protein